MFVANSERQASWLAWLPHGFRCGALANCSIHECQGRCCENRMGWVPCAHGSFSVCRHHSKLQIIAFLLVIPSQRKTSLSLPMWVFEKQHHLKDDSYSAKLIMKSRFHAPVSVNLFLRVARKEPSLCASISTSSLRPRASETRLEQISVFNMLSCCIVSYGYSSLTYIAVMFLMQPEWKPVWERWASWCHCSTKLVDRSAGVFSKAHEVQVPLAMLNFLFVLSLLTNLPRRCSQVPWASALCGYPLWSWDFPRYFTFPRLMFANKGNIIEAISIHSEWFLLKGEESTHVIT